MTSWCLTVAGTPALRSVADVPAVLPLSRKDAALLTYVAIAGSSPSARVALLLWPGDDPRRALNSLRQRLHRLRRATSGRLLEVADTAALAADLSLVTAADAVAQLGGDAPLGELLGAYDYEDAPDFAVWLEAGRKAWAGARREALADAASAAERDGELARALVLAQRLLADDALSEHAHRRLMRLHYRRGDVAAAVAAFEACERALKDELGLKPSAETLELLRTVERSIVVAASPPPNHAVPMPASLLRPPRAVGREREHALLTQAHRDGQIAALVGEAGMGKTRLLQDFIASEPQAVYAQARPGDAAVPYGALARLLRAVVAAAPAALDRAPRGELARVAPELGPADGGGGATPAGPATRLQPAIERLLAAAVADQRRHTFVVDDLHFADRASIEMLRALVDAEALAGARWLFAHRPAGAADADGALLQALADSPRACWIALSALSGSDLVELLDSLALPGVDAAALGPALAQHTGGNPLYVLETLRAGHSMSPRSVNAATTATSASALTASAPAAPAPSLPQPPSITHLIDRRLQRLSERALVLGRVAALAGPDFSPGLAEHVLATPALLLASAWAELEAADVLRGNAFAHDLVRDGMLRATPAAIAAHAHRLIAQYLAVAAADPARLASHWLAGGDPRQAAAAFQVAARRAGKAGRPSEQAQLLERCAQALDDCGDIEAALNARIDSMNPLLQSEGGAAAVALTDRLLERAGPTTAARLWSARALALMWVGRVADAEPAAERALALADSDEDELRVNAICMLAIAKSVQGDPNAGVALLEPWVARIEQVADPEVRAGFFGNLTNLLMQADRPGQALPAARRHLALTRQLRLAGEQVTALMNLSNLFARRGELEEAVLHARQADALIPDAGQSISLLSWNRTNLGYRLAGCGRFTEALALLEAAIEAFSRLEASRMRLSLAQDCCALVWLTLGQPARAHRLVAGQPNEPAGRLRVRQLAVRWRVAQAAGLQDRCDPLDDIRAMVPESDVDRLAVELAAAAAADDDAASVARLTALQGVAEAHDHYPLAAQAAALRVTALLRGQRLGELPKLLPQAERAAHAARAPDVYLPDLLQRCATGWRAIGCEADAQRCLDRALHWVHAVALPNVAPEFVDGFLNRNAVNASLRAGLARLPGAG